MRISPLCSKPGFFCLLLCLGKSKLHLFDLLGMRVTQKCDRFLKCFTFDLGFSLFTLLHIFRFLYRTFALTPRLVFFTNQFLNFRLLLLLFLNAQCFSCACFNMLTN